MRRVKVNKPILIISAIVGLFLAYLLLTRALDTGSWWEYLGCVVFTGLSIRLMFKAVEN